VVRGLGTWGIHVCSTGSGVFKIWSGEVPDSVLFASRISFHSGNFPTLITFSSSLFTHVVGFLGGFLAAFCSGLGFHA